MQPFDAPLESLCEDDCFGDRVSGGLDNEFGLLLLKEETYTDNEVRITSQGVISNYILYAATILLEKKQPELIIKSTGNAIPKAVILAETLKRRIKGLHQDNKVQTIESTETYEPLEEGLDTITINKRLTSLEIVLSIN